MGMLRYTRQPKEFMFDRSMQSLNPIHALLVVRICVVHWFVPVLQSVRFLGIQQIMTPTKPNAAQQLDCQNMFRQSYDKRC